MRYGIFSDIHSNKEALDAVLAAYKNLSIDKYLCAGDLVGYFADPNDCIFRIRDTVEAYAAGNHDWASVDLFPVDYFNELAAEAILWTKESLNAGCKDFLRSLNLVYKNNDLTMVHGTLDYPDEFNYLTTADAARQTFKVLENQVCFLGHTHTPGIFTKEKNGRIRFFTDTAFRFQVGRSYIVNVGSVGQPRDGNACACFCIYDTEQKSIEIKRVAYDIKKTQKKTIAAGLPHFLADRLMLGR